MRLAVSIGTIFSVCAAERPSPLKNGSSYNNRKEPKIKQERERQNERKHVFYNTF